jgi:OOP family OmpA-OmpF porin
MAAGMALAFAAMVASAQAPDKGFYLGASLGQSQIKFDDASLRIGGATSSSISKNETDTAWKIFAGYRFFKYFAVEGGYTDLGKFSATTTVTAPAAGSATINFKSKGPHLEGVGILPLGNFSLFGKAGVMLTITQSSGTASGAVTFRGNPNNTTNEANFKAGIGAGYDFTRNFGMRVEAEQVFGVGDKDKTGEGDIRLFTAGLLYRF